jgi:hypothetical protein
VNGATTSKAFKAIVFEAIEKAASTPKTNFR